MSVGGWEPVAKRVQAHLSGPIPLPTEKHRFMVIKGPFKDKDSREHFEIKTQPA